MSAGPNVGVQRLGKHAKRRLRKFAAILNSRNRAEGRSKDLKVLETGGEQADTPRTRKAGL